MTDAQAWPPAAAGLKVVTIEKITGLKAGLVPQETSKAAHSRGLDSMQPRMAG